MWLLKYYEAQFSVIFSCRRGEKDGRINSSLLKSLGSPARITFPSTVTRLMIIIVKKQSASPSGVTVHDHDSHIPRPAYVKRRAGTLNLGVDFDLAVTNKSLKY